MFPIISGLTFHLPVTSLTTDTILLLDSDVETLARYNRVTINTSLLIFSFVLQLQTAGRKTIIINFLLLWCVWCVCWWCMRWFMNDEYHYQEWSYVSYSGNLRRSKLSDRIQLRLEVSCCYVDKALYF